MYQVVVTEFLAPSHLFRVVTSFITSCITADRAIQVPKGEQVFGLLISVAHTEVVVFLLIIQQLESLDEQDEIDDIILIQFILVFGIELRVARTQ